MQIDLIFGIVILIFSIILHEVAHGYMANYLGDPTAKFAGRLTLNPISHIDPLGSILLPGILALTGSSFLIGYAKPVPYNPYNLRHKHGELLVAAAGPATNIFLALFFGLLIRFGTPFISEATFTIFTLIVIINIVLALFNLIPIPPLDGSKILSGILPGAAGQAYDTFRAYFERLGILTSTLILLLLFIYVLAPIFFSIIRSVFLLLTGVPL